jgi:DNA-binding GntR family transcriptional regulator
LHAMSTTPRPGEPMSSTMSEYIRQDLMSRIGSSRSLPFELTLSSLSRHYSVSFTPVREAVRDLVAEGVLLKGDNGRVAVNPSPSRRDRKCRAAESPKPPTQSADLEASLAEELIERSLRGDSEYIREEAAARRHRVGRTAIRQVFSRLAGRGLIVHVPRCGWRVRLFDESDLNAYLETRESLELKALDLARPRLAESELRQMLSGNVADAQSPRIDNDIHRYMIEKSQNSYISDFFSRHGAFYTTLFDYAAPETHVVAEMARQHGDILKALIAKDWRGARRALAHHIRAQQPIVLELMRCVGRPQSRSNPAEETAP